MSRAFSATSAPFIFKDACKEQSFAAALQGALRALSSSSLYIGNDMGGLEAESARRWRLKAAIISILIGINFGIRAKTSVRVFSPDSFLLSINK